MAAAAREALGGRDAASVALVYGTGYGGLTATVDFLEGMAVRGPAFASPMSFHQSVHNSPAGALSIALGIRGACLTVTARELSGETALKVGLDLLASHRAEQVLVVAADEVVPALEAGYRAFGSRLIPGEGAAAVLLGAASAGGAGDAGGAVGPSLVVELCALDGHVGSLLRLQASPEALSPLLDLAARVAGPEPWVSPAPGDDAFRSAQRLALERAFPRARIADDGGRFGFNPSGGLLRLVSLALRLGSGPGGAGVIHGAAQGGGQAVIVVRHVAG